MTQSSTLGVERPTPGICKITFSNPPVNLIVGETVSRLVAVVTQLSEDPQVQVAIFTSSTPGHFFNHFDLRRAADFAPPPDPAATPAWTDLVVRLSTAPFFSIASVRGRTRGGGNELAVACDLRYAAITTTYAGRDQRSGSAGPDIGLPAQGTRRS